MERVQIIQTGYERMPVKPKEHEADNPSVTFAGMMKEMQQAGIDDLKEEGTAPETENPSEIEDDDKRPVELNPLELNWDCLAGIGLPPESAVSQIVQMAEHTDFVEPALITDQQFTKAGDLVDAEGPIVGSHAIEPETADTFTETSMGKTETPQSTAMQHPIDIKQPVSPKPEMDEPVSVQNSPQLTTSNAAPGEMPVQVTEEKAIVPEVKKNLVNKPDETRKESRTDKTDIGTTAHSEDSSVNQVHKNFTASAKEIMPADHAPVETTPDTLVQDVGNAMAARMPQKNGMLTIELEPASLGKLTIKVEYEAGKAAVSILSANPKTLELLSQKAGEIAGILEEKTGQQTYVYTHQTAQQYDDRQSEDNHENGRNQGRENREEQRRGHTDSFAQQLRLGLV